MRLLHRQQFIVESPDADFNLLSPSCETLYLKHHRAHLDFAPRSHNAVKTSGFVSGVLAASTPSRFRLGLNRYIA